MGITRPRPHGGVKRIPLYLLYQHRKTRESETVYTSTLPLFTNFKYTVVVCGLIKFL